MALFFYGINFGVLIAIVAIGFSLIYGSLKIIDFSHADRLTLGAYVFLSLNQIGLIYAILGSCISCMVFAVLVERLLYSKLRSKGSTAIMIASVGVSIVLQAMLAMIYRSSLMTSAITESTINFFHLRIYIRELVMGGLLLTCGISLFFILKTKIGWSLAAIASNYEQAVIFRIPVNKMISLTFAVSSLLAAFAGISIAVSSGIYPYAGFKFLIFAFAACMVGGLGHLGGTITASLGLGVIYTFAEAYGSSLAADASVLSILVITLYIKPRGFFNRRIRLF